MLETVGAPHGKAKFEKEGRRGKRLAREPELQDSSPADAQQAEPPVAAGRPRA